MFAAQSDRNQTNQYYQYLRMLQRCGGPLCLCFKSFLIFEAHQLLKLSESCHYPFLLLCRILISVSKDKSTIAFMGISKAVASRTLLLPSKQTVLLETLLRIDETQANMLPAVGDALLLLIHFLFDYSNYVGSADRMMPISSHLDVLPYDDQYAECVMC